MAIRFNPCAPCCGAVAGGKLVILAGLHCLSWVCDPNIKYRYRFPQQKITLSRIGYNRVGYTSDYEVLKVVDVPTTTVDSSELSSYQSYIPYVLNGSSYSGNTPIGVIIFDEHKSNTWYKITYEMEYGILERVFYVSDLKQGLTMYMPLVPSSFLNIIQPGDENYDPAYWGQTTTGYNYNIDYVCASPCIVNTTIPLTVDIDFNVDLTSYSYDIASAGFNVYKVTKTFTNVNKNISAECHYSGHSSLFGWNSEYIRLYTVEELYEYYACTKPEYACWYKIKYDVFVAIAITAGPYIALTDEMTIINGCDENSNILAWNIRLIPTIDNIERYEDTGEKKIWEWTTSSVGFYNAGPAKDCRIIQDPLYPYAYGEITYSKDSTTLYIPLYDTTIVNPSCSLEFSSETLLTKQSENGCAIQTGTISQNA